MPSVSESLKRDPWTFRRATGRWRRLTTIERCFSKKVCSVSYFTLRENVRGGS